MGIRANTDPEKQFVVIVKGFGAGTLVVARTPGFEGSQRYIMSEADALKRIGKMEPNMYELLEVTPRAVELVRRIV